MKTFREHLSEAQKFGKQVATHNDHPIHDDGKDKGDRRFLVYKPGHAYINSSHKTLAGAKKQATSSNKPVTYNAHSQNHKDKLGRGDYSRRVGTQRQRVNGRGS